MTKRKNVYHQYDVLYRCANCRESFKLDSTFRGRGFGTVKLDSPAEVLHKCYDGATIRGVGHKVMIVDLGEVSE